MKLRVGYELVYQCPQRTPMILMLNIHSSRAQSLIVPDVINIFPYVPIRHFHDTFGNLCSRIVAPPGEIRLTTDALIEVPDYPEVQEPGTYQHDVADLPDDCLQFLLGSRYCESDLLSNIAWQMFGHLTPGRDRVQAICDYAHQQIIFDYNFARPTKTAFEAYNEKIGVCRDYAHLAISLCRAMNIPARYCTGYISDIGLPPNPAPMDFCAWFEAYLGNTWQTFDPRNNAPRTGRVLMARGRDAADVSITHSFGQPILAKFLVVCEPG